MRNLQYLYWLSLPDTQQHLHGRHCTRSNMHQTTTTHARRSSLVIVRPNVSNPNPDRTTTLLGLHTLLGRIHARQRALHAPPRCARLRAVTEDAILTLLRAVTGAPAPLALAAAVAPARRRPVHAPPRLLPAPLLSVAEHPVTACNGGTGLASLVNACFCTVTEQTVVAVTVLQAVVAHHFLLGTQFRCTRDTSRRTPTRDLVTHLRAVTENAVITRDGVARFARPLRAHLLSIAEQSILAVGGAGTDEARVLPAKPHTHHRLSALHSAELDQDLAVGCRVDVVLARAQRRHDGRRLQPIPHHCRHLVGVLLCLGVGARLLVVAHVQVQLVAGRDANHDRVVGATAPSRVLSMPDHAPTRLGGRVRHRGLAADEPLEGEVLGRVEAHERGVAAVVAEPHHPALVAVQELRVARVVQVEVVPDLVHLRRQRRAPGMHHVIACRNTSSGHQSEFNATTRRGVFDADGSPHQLSLYTDTLCPRYAYATHVSAEFGGRQKMMWSNRPSGPSKSAVAEIAAEATSYLSTPATSWSMETSATPLTMLSPLALRKTSWLSEHAAYWLVTVAGSALFPNTLLDSWVADGVTAKSLAVTRTTRTSLAPTVRTALRRPPTPTPRSISSAQAGTISSTTPPSSRSASRTCAPMGAKLLEISVTPSIRIHLPPSLTESRISAGIASALSS
mmetsp:Transcript_2908/g.5836  ORF Transcript_2908/g.5836 Transcript_2908/m.5836 type:complete len:678 (-) Transcript_2908:198-2231(-)